MTDTTNGPHQGQQVLAAGTPIEQAKGAIVLIHGRGASAESILGLGAELNTEGWALIAPQAANFTWYPYSFLAPIRQNEPYLSSALSQIAAVLAHLAEAGIPAERTVLLGFSQGACLASEYAAQHARRYGAVVALSGGLIGPDGTPREYAGSMGGTPVFFGCSDIDPHIPVGRVHESAKVIEQIGGAVTKRIYPGMGHTVNQDELDWINETLHQISL